MLGLTGVVWAILAVEVVLHRLDSMTVALAAGFTAMMVAWPFAAGLRVTPEGPRQLPVCRECQRLLPLALNVGFCIYCGARDVRPTQRYA